MKIINFNSFKNSVNKLDAMTRDDSPASLFPQNYDRTSAKDFFDKFFSIADGNNSHNDF